MVRVRGDESILRRFAGPDSPYRVNERHFVLLKEHVMKGRLVGAPSLDWFRMSLQLKRIGGISEKEHAADVDGKVAEILNNNDCVEVEGDSSASSAGPPPLRSSSKGKRPATKSGAGAGRKPVDRGVGARGCGKHLGRQHHQLLGQSYRQTGKMVYAIYTAVLLVLYCCYMWRVLYCCVMLCVRTSYYVQYTNCTVPSLPIIPFTRFAFALLNFLGSQHRIVLFKVLLCGGFCFCIRCTTVVLPALEVLSVFCFRCSYKTAVR